MATDMKQDMNKQVSEVLEDVRIPLLNIEHALEQYLHHHRTRLDPETRFLLAGVRECIGRVAISTNEIIEREYEVANPAELEDRPHALAS